LKKRNKFMKVGLLIIAIILLPKNFSAQLPDFIQGLGYGVGIALELIGIYSINHDIFKFKNYKTNLLKNVLISNNMVHTTNFFKRG